MRIDIITIGHSQGIRLPKSLLTHCGFHKSVELEIKNGEMIKKTASSSYGLERCLCR